MVDFPAPLVPRRATVSPRGPQARRRTDLDGAVAEVDVGDLEDRRGPPPPRPAALFLLFLQQLRYDEREVVPDKRAPFMSSSPPMMLVGTPRRMTVSRVPMALVKKPATISPGKPR